MKRNNIGVINNKASIKHQNNKEINKMPKFDSIKTFWYEGS